MREQLRVELTPEEREQFGDSVVAIEFCIGKNGAVIVSEEWADMDELYGDGCSITIPPRIWAEGLKWLASRPSAP